MQQDLFTQIREIHEALRPTPAAQAATLRASQVRWTFVLGVALVLVLLAVLIAARVHFFPVWTLISLEALALVLMAVYITREVSQVRRELQNTEIDAHAALDARSELEARNAAHLRGYNRAALEYVLAEYDSNLEAVERASAVILGPARAGGILGAAALLLSTYLGAYKGAGLWVLAAVLILGAFTAGGLAGFKGYEGLRRTRALLARVVALKGV